MKDEIEQEVKHTPGPLEVGQCGILNEHGEALFVTGSDGTVWWQNAADPYLFAAAPDLLAFAKAYRLDLQERGVSESDMDDCAMELLSMADAAIAKAEIEP